MTQILVWTIVGVTILLILVRPRSISEAAWACGSAALLLVSGLISPRDAYTAIGRGVDVYLFLTGMMILAELARREGVFDWLAVIAVKAANGSQARLFLLVYLVGTAVTIFLSNDATAVVLTPAVLAAVRTARAPVRPYLFICAFIANAASFVLPISNPANLVVYASQMPSLAQWLRTFGLASLVSIVVTFVALRIVTRHDLAGPMAHEVAPVALSSTGRCAAFGIIGAAMALLLASTLDVPLGLPTFVAALAAAAVVALFDPTAPLGILHDVSWSVLPLVAGLFVLVAAVNQVGALSWSHAALVKAAMLPPLAGSLSTAFGVAALTNVANNLPVGLIAGGAVHAGPVAARITNALLIGVDLGPNLSVTGSLATILWLVALRRDGHDVSFWAFLRAGVIIMPPALALSTIAATLTSR